MFVVSIIILLISIVVGYNVISQVPPLLHTPLMSGMNALSGITVLGALFVFAAGPPVARYGASVAIILAVTNIAGGFWVTERMLRMFRKKNRDRKEDSS